MTVTIVTANYGDLDTPIEQPQQDIPCRWVCVTRIPKPSATWENVVEPRPYLTDRMAAKVPKWRPDRYTDDEIVVWFDGSVTLKHPGAVRKFIEPLHQGYDLAIVPHPHWNTVERESRVAQTQNRHVGQMLEEQYLSYHEEFGEPGPDVWATAVTARRVTSETCAFGDAVLLELLRWSVHDQLCAPAVIHRMGLKVGRIDVEGHFYFGNPYSYLRVLNRPEDGE